MSIKVFPAPYREGPQLCSTLLENSEQEAFWLNCRGYVFKIAAIIASLAAVTMLYLGTIIASSSMLISIPVYILGALSGGIGIRLWRTADRIFERKASHQDIANKCDNIGNTWVRQNFIDFFRNHEIPVEPFALEEPFIANYNRILDREHQQLVPLIARFQFLTEQTNRLKSCAEENLQKARDHEAAGQNNLKSEHSTIATQFLEEAAFTQLIRAVVCQNLRFPHREWVCENTDQGIALKSKGAEQPLGYVQPRNPEKQPPDAALETPPPFFKGVECSDMTLEFLVASEPSVIRQELFDEQAPGNVLGEDVDLS